MKSLVFLLLFASSTGAVTGAEIRQPFAMSPSMLDMCWKQREVMLCQQVEEFLALMSAEPRDDAWATAMESRLRKAFDTGGKGLVKIRALACHATRCAVEYAVDLQAAGPNFDMGRIRFPAALKPGVGAQTREPNPRTLVSLQCFTKST